MSLIADILKEINPSILRNIENSFSSIYKINKEHHLFISLLNENDKLKNAEYIVYPNINNNINTIFLDASGKEVLVFKEGISEFILLPTNFEANIDYIQLDNPYHKNFSI